MPRIIVGVMVMCAVAAALVSQPQSFGKLTAPTYYIAANAEYRHSQEIWLRGASNLPSGAVLVVDVQNYVGEGSQVLSASAQPRIGKDGFFETTLTPLPNMQFKHNVVCLVSFLPNIPGQDSKTREVVGPHGEHLGFPRNPQAFIHSGENVYLHAAIHVE